VQEASRGEKFTLLPAWVYGVSSAIVGESGPKSAVSWLESDVCDADSEFGIANEAVGTIGVNLTGRDTGPRFRGG
jgi:hypothetical protein